MNIKTASFSRQNITDSAKANQFNCRERERQRDRGQIERVKERERERGGERGRERGGERGRGREREKERESLYWLVDRKDKLHQFTVYCKLHFCSYHFRSLRPNSS